MHFSVDCPRCLHRYEVDDADPESTVCPECRTDWICNRDAEPELEDDSLEADSEGKPWEFPSDSHPEETSEQLAEETWNEIAIPARPRRPPSSPIRKLIPPILGGVSAIPIAIAILWYGFGRDLGNAGPTVAKYVPWIVPEHLRGRGFRRAQAKPPSPAIVNDKRDIGKLGARADTPSAPAPGRRTEIQESSQPSVEEIDPSDTIEESISSMGESDDLLSAMLSRAQSTREEWEAQPDEPWPEVQLRIVRNVYESAEQWSESKETTPAVSSAAANQLVRMLDESWFRDTLTNRATGALKGASPLTVHDFVLWPVDIIRQDPIDSTKLDWQVKPQLVMDSLPVQWIIDESLTPGLSDREETDLNDTKLTERQLLVGQIERLDELDCVIRVIAILP